MTAAGVESHGAKGRGAAAQKRSGPSLQVRYDACDTERDICDVAPPVTLGHEKRRVTDCGACSGTGNLWVGYLQRQVPCPACGNRGVIIGDADPVWVSAVFRHYGTACACCGSTERLTIDHVNGNGKEHRAAIGGDQHFYSWLIANDFPPGFQTLCRSCNSSKGQGERCRRPHPEVRLVTGRGGSPEPRLVLLVKRVADLKGRPQLNPSERDELTVTCAELAKHWPATAADLVRAYEAGE